VILFFVAQIEGPFSVFFWDLCKYTDAKGHSILRKKLPNPLHMEQHPYVNQSKMMVATLLSHCHSRPPPPLPTTAAADITVIVVVILAVTVANAALS
jgi:hypothetical protein